MPNVSRTGRRSHGRRLGRRDRSAVAISVTSRLAQGLSRAGWSFVALAAIAILVSCYWIGGSLSYSDERDYVEIANSLAGGHGYRLKGQLTAFRPPTWVLVLAPPAALGASNQVLSVIPGICLIAAALLAARLVTRTAGRPWGVIAAIVVILYPLNVYSATTLYPQVLAMTLLIWLWLLLAKLDRRRNLNKSEALVSGFLCAALALAVPTMVYTSGAILAWMLIQHRQRLRFFLLAGIGFGAPILAWVARNMAVMGSPVLFSTTSGINLLLGNNPNATPSSGVRADITADLEQADRLGLGEVARNDFFAQSAMQWIRDDPAGAAYLYLGKLVHYFSAYNEPATEGQGSDLHALVAWTAMLTVAALVVVRIVLSRRGVLPITKHEKFMLFLFVTNGPFMAIFFTRTRFRQPLDAILLVEAALAVAALLVVRARKTTEDVDREDDSTPHASSRSAEQPAS